jgi:hypothetical protein
MLREITEGRSEPRTRADVRLPTEAIMRWTPWRKRSVILAVRAGELTMREASARYMLSQEELASWIADFERRGVTGLLLKCGKREMALPVPAAAAVRD